MATGIFWVKFPEINREVAFCASSYSSGAMLGCHTGSISNVQVSTGDCVQTPATGNGWVKVLDETKENPIKLVDASSSYSPYKSIPQEEKIKVIKYLNKSNFDVANFKQQCFASLVEASASIPLWLLSDVINYESIARNGGLTPEAKLEKQNDIAYIDTYKKTVFKTIDFARYLIEYNIGYVMSSPIVHNPNHKMYGNYSLNQVWFWIPEPHIARAIDVDRDMGKEKFPSRKEWIDTISKDFMGNGSLASLQTKPSYENVVRDVFNERRFPDYCRFAKEA